MNPASPAGTEHCEVYHLDDAQLAAAVRDNVQVIINGRTMQMGRFEVTQAQWSEVMGDNPSTPAEGCGPDLPVSSVSWQDAMRYSNRLSRRMDLEPVYRVRRARWHLDVDATGYRLPTVEEWRWAALGDGPEIGSAPCAFGNILGAEAAEARPEVAGTLVVGPNGVGTSLHAACNDGYARLAPVGHFVSPTGLLNDAIGNAAEWVQLDRDSAEVGIIGGAYWMGSSWAELTRPVRMMPTMTVGGLRLVRVIDP